MPKENYENILQYESISINFFEITDSVGV